MTKSPKFPLFKLEALYSFTAATGTHYLFAGKLYRPERYLVTVSTAVSPA